MGGEPRFDLAPGPACKKLLATYCWKVIGQSVTRERFIAIGLLAGHAPPCLRVVRKETQHLWGMSSAQIQKIAAKERAAAK